MSKSKGNVVDINAIFNTDGADSLRWYLFTAGPLTGEGLVRDIVRRIQGMRKDLDLEYTARIRILIAGFMIP